MLFAARKEYSSVFIGAALLCLVGGWGIAALLPGSSLERIVDYFPVGPFRIAAGAVGGLAVLAIFFTLLESVTGWSRSAEAGPLHSSGANIDETLEEVRGRVAEAADPSRMDVGAILDHLLQGGMLLQSSDIHLNPLGNGLKVTYRIDGVLYGVCTIENDVAPRITQRVKVLAHLDAFAHRPQDGVLRRTVGDHAIEARVSVLPANHGERVVLRLVRGGEAINALLELGIDGDLRRDLESILSKPQGLLFVSGPVGSGKTTTLYSSLRHIHETRGETTSIMTLEDPIELQLPFATQTQINAKVGMSFAQTLRTVLRQDPGALMVGEIRDEETAQIASQAGLTGHLILTTVHVDSAAGTFTRLMEMKVEPYVLSSATVGSLAQRLVRGLCPHCRRREEPTQEERDRFSSLGHPVGPGDYHVPVGCDRCGGRGYDRRIPIAELLLMSDPIKEAIRERRSTEDVHRIAIGKGMVPLATQGLKLAAAGETSLQEVLRVAG